MSLGDPKIAEVTPSGVAQSGCTSDEVARSHGGEPVAGPRWRHVAVPSLVLVEAEVNPSRFSGNAIALGELHRGPTPEIVDGKSSCDALRAA